MNGIDEETQGVEGQENPSAETDPWAAAFETLAQGSAGSVEEDAGGLQDGGEHGDDDGQEPAGSPSLDTGGADAPDAGSASESQDMGLDAADDGGFGDAAGATGDGDGSSPVFDAQAGQAALDALDRSAKSQAMQEVAKMMMDRGVRSKDGKLGATINDADILKRDEDGRVRFINPDTGLPFSGDNPRAQARTWVKDYNDELKEAYDTLVERRVAELQKATEPTRRLIEFAPTFEKLDPMRQSMLDAVIQDYEVTDNAGKVIGYSCDLNKALGQVERQIESVRAYGERQKKADKPKPSSPSTDMKTRGKATTQKRDHPDFKSLDEAMAWLQDNQTNGRK